MVCVCVFDAWGEILAQNMAPKGVCVVGLHLHLHSPTYGCFQTASLPQVFVFCLLFFIHFPNAFKFYLKVYEFVFLFFRLMISSRLALSSLL